MKTELLLTHGFTFPLISVVAQHFIVTNLRTFILVYRQSRVRSLGKNATSVLTWRLARISGAGQQGR
jgi:hypothetical protein